MKILNAHISFKIILKIILVLVISGMFFMVFSVHRMNTILSTNPGFNKDSVVSLKTVESPVILQDTFVFSSELPGFNTRNRIVIKSNLLTDNINLGHQYISSNFFDFFNYKIVFEDSDLLNEQNISRLVYINQTALEKLKIKTPSDAVGQVIMDKNNNTLLICGVVQNYYKLAYDPVNQAKIFELTSEHLAYAFIDHTAFDELLQKQDLENRQAEYMSFQQRIEKKNRMSADLIYSGFFFLNVLLLMLCLGYVGSKYAGRKEVELVKVLGIGIHILTLLISKTYVYLITLVALVIGPMVFVIQKFWLDIYTHRINFGWFNLFIILSMALLTVFMICCPASKLKSGVNLRVS